MGLFRPYERSTDKKQSDKPQSEKKSSSRLSELTPKKGKAPEAAPQPAPGTPSDDIEPGSGRRRKSGPTPTRRQAEAERMERLHPTLSPRQQRKADRDSRSQARMEAMDRMEMSPERVLLRDFIDARWTVNEFVLPAMILLMAGTMATINNIVLSTWIAIGLWLLMIMAFINTWIMWRSYKRLLSQRVPGASTRGLLMYMFNRALMIRRFRRPSPRIARGDSF